MEALRVQMAVLQAAPQPGTVTAPSALPSPAAALPAGPEAIGTLTPAATAEQGPTALPEPPPARTKGRVALPSAGLAAVELQLLQSLPLQPQALRVSRARYLQTESVQRQWDLREGKSLAAVQTQLAAARAALLAEVQKQDYLAILLVLSQHGRKLATLVGTSYKIDSLSTYPMVGMFYEAIKKHPLPTGRLSVQLQAHWDAARGDERSGEFDAEFCLPPLSVLIALIRLFETTGIVAAAHAALALKQGSRSMAVYLRGLTEAIETLVELNQGPSEDTVVSLLRSGITDATAVQQLAVMEASRVASGGGNMTSTETMLFLGTLAAVKTTATPGAAATPPPPSAKKVGVNSIKDTARENPNPEEAYDDNDLYFLSGHSLHADEILFVAADGKVDFKNTACGNCLRSGHFARSCPNPAVRRDPRTVMSTYQQVSRPPGVAGLPGAQRKPMRCFSCQVVGHMARDCPTPTAQRKTPTGTFKQEKLTKEGATWVEKLALSSGEVVMAKDGKKLVCGRCFNTGHTKADCKGQVNEANRP